MAIAGAGLAGRGAGPVAAHLVVAPAVLRPDGDVHLEALLGQRAQVHAGGPALALLGLDALAVDDHAGHDDLRAARTQADHEVAPRAAVVRGDALDAAAGLHDDPRLGRRLRRRFGLGDRRPVGRDELGPPVGVDEGRRVRAVGAGEDQPAAGGYALEAAPRGLRVERGAGVEQPEAVG